MNGRVAVDADQQEIAKLTRCLQVRDMTDVKQIETSVGHDQALASGPELGSPLREMVERDDLVSRIHRPNLWRGEFAWQWLIEREFH